MREFNSVGEFARFLATLPAAVERAEHRAVLLGAQMVRDEAKAEIGHYQQEFASPVSGDVVPAWPELAERTKRERVALGFTENDPLLRTGELRASITASAQGNRAAAGSDLDVAEWQEMGTPTIPPRSFLAGAAIRKAEAIVNMMGARIAWVLSGLPARND